MAGANAKVYRSFEEFERSELRGPTNFHATIDELFDEMFQDEFQAQAEENDSAAGRHTKKKNHSKTRSPKNSTPRSGFLAA